MKILSPVSLLVAAALIGITAESAWSEEATPGDVSAPAGQAAAPGPAMCRAGIPASQTRRVCTTLATTATVACAPARL